MSNFLYTCIFYFLLISQYISFYKLYTIVCYILIDLTCDLNRLTGFLKRVMNTTHCIQPRQTERDRMNGRWGIQNLGDSKLCHIFSFFKSSSCNLNHILIISSKLHTLFSFTVFYNFQSLHLFQKILC